MDRRFRRQGLDPTVISPLERLAWVGRRTMGALTGHPSTQADDAAQQLVDLHERCRIR